jgi:copper(I)-binding protein
MPTLLLIASTLLFLSTPPALAQTTAAQAIQVGKSFVRAVPPGQKVSAAFMAIENTSTQTHRLISAESKAAQVVELHTHTHVDGMMKMRKIDAIELPAGQTTLLQPGGLHVMLIGLNTDLTVGQVVSVTLNFEDASRKTLEIPVLQMTRMGQMNGMSH